MKTALLTVFFSLVTQALGSDCSALRSLPLSHATITVAQAEASGRFQPPYGSAIENAPAFCRVAGVFEPTPDSYVRFEIWLPERDWNGKFLGVGNGGFAGSISYRGLAGNIGRGYATAATDTGHEGDGEDASWAYKHPEKIVDFGNRAIHLTAVAAKAAIEAFYGKKAQHAYFDSCSDGGREALMEAQRFPEDYDGILAGAPAYDWTRLTTGGLDAAQRMIGHPESYLSAMKLPAITAAVMAACDALDGVKDGVIGDPAKCHFDPSVLRCQGREEVSCLTDPQIATLRRLYAGSKLGPGLVPGGESGANSWGDWVVGQGPGGASGTVYLQNYLRYMVFDDPGLDILKVNQENAFRVAERKTAEALNATSPDLSRFQARGGKLLLYHGWNDAAISPWGTIRYYESVQKTLGASIAGQFVRLYMIPGMQHCLGGPGPNSFGQLGLPTAKGPKYGIYSALEDWVEADKMPGPIVATKYAGDNPSGKALVTRPLCPYPQTAHYREGGADPNDASSFSCEATK